MVSCDTCISGSFGYCSANHPEICCGDHRASSLRSTTRREPPAPGELRLLGSQRSTLCSTIGHQRPILRPASVRVHFPTDRRSRTAHLASDRPERQTRSYAPRDLLTLRQRQPQLTTLPSTRTPSTRISNELPHRRVLPPQMLGDALDRHARLAHIPDRLLVLLARTEPPQHLPIDDTNARQSRPRCVDQLRTQPIWDTRRYHNGRTIIGSCCADAPPGATSLDSDQMEPDSHGRPTRPSVE